MSGGSLVLKSLSARTYQIYIARVFPRVPYPAIYGPHVATNHGIVKTLEKTHTLKTVLKMAIFAVVSASTFLVARRVRAWWEERNSPQQRHEIIFRERTDADIEGLSDIQICTVCLVNPREVILMNCGHVCVCADCALQLRGKCPVCRSRIVYTHKAYIA